METYPSNSYKSKREAKKEPPTVEPKKPVISGKVTAKKDTAISHILSELIPNTASEIGKNILDDIVIPGIRAGIHGAIDTIFGGTNGTTYYSSPSGRINYSNISRNQSTRGTTIQSNMARKTYEFENLIFASRGDAEAVLDEMLQHIYAYEMVRVSDLFEFAGVSCDYTAQKYGWTDLSTARILRTFDGWKIEFPKAIVLD